jgi:hypothetical protein
MKNINQRDISLNDDSSIEQKRKQIFEQRKINLINKYPKYICYKKYNEFLIRKEYKKSKRNVILIEILIVILNVIVLLILGRLVKNIILNI